MDSVTTSEVSQDKRKLGRTLAKFLHFKSRSGHSSGDGKKMNKNEPTVPPSEEDEQMERLVKEAFFAGVFACVSTIKAAYAQLQMAQYTYDPGEIHSADGVIVAELKNLSELKHSFVNKKLQETSPETAIASYQIQELKGMNLTYEATSKKLDSQIKHKESKLASLKEKLAEIQMENRRLKKKLSSSGRLDMQRNISVSSLKPSFFTVYRQQAVESIQSFVRLLIRGMECADWDIGAAADAIDSGACFLKPGDKCYAFESFVCREMFSGFSDQECIRALSFEGFSEVKSIKPSEYLASKRQSHFATFCQKRYLRVVHPEMEASLFGNLEQRQLLESGEFPDTPFFLAFSEMAKDIWLLHCLAFSFSPKASIFQVPKGSPFSEVWMESLNDDAFFSDNNNVKTDDLKVALTVFPGFRVGGTVLPCQVYLHQS